MYKESIFKKIMSLGAILAMALSMVSTGVQFAYAAQLTNLSDTLSNATAAEESEP